MPPKRRFSTLLFFLFSLFFFIACEKKAPIEIVKVSKDDYVNSGDFKGEGKYKMYNQNKQISKDGLFKAYRLMDGLLYQYNDNGILTKVKRFKDGRYIGDAPLPKD